MGGGLFTSGWIHGNAVYWDLETGRRSPLPDWFTGYPASIVSISADGGRLAIQDRGWRVLRIVDAETGKVIHEIPWTDGYTWRAFSADLGHALVEESGRGLHLRSIPDMEIVGKRLGVMSHSTDPVAFRKWADSSESMILSSIEVD